MTNHPADEAFDEVLDELKGDADVFGAARQGASKMRDRWKDHEAESDEWEFESGDVIREREEPHAPGGVPIGKSEYRIKWRLRRESDGKRCYHVEKEEGGTHLYTAATIEGRYEVIDPSESRAWSDDTGSELEGSK